MRFSGTRLSARLRSLYVLVRGETDENRSRAILRGPRRGARIRCGLRVRAETNRSDRPNRRRGHKTVLPDATPRPPGRWRYRLTGLQPGCRLLDRLVQPLEVFAGVRPRVAGVHDLLGVAETHVQHGTRDLDRVDGREAVTAQPSGSQPSRLAGSG